MDVTRARLIIQAGYYERHPYAWNRGQCASCLKSDLRGELAFHRRGTNLYYCVECMDDQIDFEALGCEACIGGASGDELCSDTQFSHSMAGLDPLVSSCHRVPWFYAGINGI